MRKNKKSRWIERLMVAVLLVAMAFQIEGTSSQAATSGWSLRFAKGAPTSAQVTSWSKTAKAKKTKPSMKVSSFSARDTGGGNNGWVYLKVPGIGSFVNRPTAVKATGTVRVGKPVTGKATITNTNILNNLKASGSFTY